MQQTLDPEILETICVNTGENLRELSEQNLVMLVFLRHFGCTFCREALVNIAQIQPELEGNMGIKLVLVHMADDEVANEYLAKYKMPNVAHIADPDRSLYEYFGLFKGTFWQIYGLKIWARGLKVGILDGHGLTLDKKLGNFTQMPGVFFIRNCEIQNSYIHKSSADFVDYSKLAKDSLQKETKKTTDLK